MHTHIGRPAGERRTRRIGAALATLSAAALIAGCGGDGGSDATASEDAGSPSEEKVQFAVPEDVGPVGPDTAGAVLQYADCYDWNDGTQQEKKATVVELREQLTPQVSEDTSSPLGDDDALKRLEKTCTSGYPQSLRLYKLYVRMQSYGSLADVG